MNFNLKRIHESALSYEARDLDKDPYMFVIKQTEGEPVFKKVGSKRRHHEAFLPKKIAKIVHLHPKQAIKAPEEKEDLVETKDFDKERPVQRPNWQSYQLHIGDGELVPLINKRGIKTP